MSDYTPRIIRFVRASLDLGVDSSIAVVEVETPGLGRFVGSAQGGIREADQLRTVARATADALSDAFDAQNAPARAKMESGISNDARVARCLVSGFSTDISASLSVTNYL